MFETRFIVSKAESCPIFWSTTSHILKLTSQRLRVKERNPWAQCVCPTIEAWVFELLL
jgi:hypothetical protein